MKKTKPYLLVVAATLFAPLFCSGQLLAQSSDPVPIKMNVLLVLDSSASMWGEVGGKPKYESTREILGNVIKNLPPDTQFGMLAYGHRRSNDCGDIELIAPIGSKSAQEITDIATSFRPKGTTPLSDSLKQAAEALKNVNGGKMVVLITDGAEECSGDPCEVARQLALSGTVVKVNVVGLSLTEKERQQLQCVAREGGGRYFDVQNKQTMFKAIDEIGKDVHKELEFFSRSRDAVPTPVPTPEPERTNLLNSEHGGKIAKADSSRWQTAISGMEGTSAWGKTGQEVVFEVGGGKPVSFSRFAIEVPERGQQNVREFELSYATKSAEGPYTLIDRFEVQNVAGNNPFQEFKFTPVTARFVKFKLLSNYGQSMESWGNTQVYQLKLLADPK